MAKPSTNIPASVRARLLNRARAEGRSFNELLQYYAMERFLYRLSKSEHADLFVLKGGLMLQIWGGSLTRATKDIDLHRAESASVADLVRVVKDCLNLPVEDDGIRFDPKTIKGEAIRLAAKHNGVRIVFGGVLDQAKVTVQVDIGFADIITPSAQPISYPTLLDFGTPELLGYTPETTIAEKFEAMVSLDMANTRLKDFLDIWTLAKGRSFDGGVLAQAIHATFSRRATELPTSTPIALTSAYSSASDKCAQWKAYEKKASVRGGMPSLAEATDLIGAFVMPVVEAIRAGDVFAKSWPPGGPWRD
jgi:predicted nucleotidyltransferase component of viral defense system